MEIGSDSELGTIYSPTHEVTINRKDDQARANIRYEGKDIDPDDNFSMLLLGFRRKFWYHPYSLTVTDEDEDGYFMLHRFT